MDIVDKISRIPIKKNGYLNIGKNYIFKCACNRLFSLIVDNWPFKKYSLMKRKCVT